MFPVWDGLRCARVALDHGIVGDSSYIRRLHPSTRSLGALWSPPVLRRTADSSPKAVIRGRAHGSGNPSPFGPGWGVAMTSAPWRANCFKAFSIYVRCTLHWVGGFREEKLGHFWFPSSLGAPLQLRVLSSRAGCFAFLVSPDLFRSQGIFYQASYLTLSMVYLVTWASVIFVYMVCEGSLQSVMGHYV